MWVFVLVGDVYHTSYMVHYFSLPPFFEIVFVKTNKIAKDSNGANYQDLNNTFGSSIW